MTLPTDDKASTVEGGRKSREVVATTAERHSLVALAVREVVNAQIGRSEMPLHRLATSLPCGYLSFYSPFLLI